MVWSEVCSFHYITVLGPHQDSSWVSCCVSVLWRPWSFESEGQVPLHSPVDHRWGECWGGAIVTLELDRGKLGWPASQFSPVLTARVSSPASPQLFLLLQQWARCGASSPGFMPSELTLHTCSIRAHLLVISGGDQGSLSWVLQLSKGRDNPPVLMTQGQLLHLPYVLMGRRCLGISPLLLLLTSDE